jgi:hypothetical protein
MATKAQIAKMQSDLKKAEADLKKARAAAAKKPVPPTSGVIPGFSPAITMPTPAARSDEPRFVGPVAPVVTPASKTPAGPDYMRLGMFSDIGASAVGGVTGPTGTGPTGTGPTGTGPYLYSNRWNSFHR